MLFSRSLFIAVISAPFLAFAQNGDGLALTTTSSFQITAGEPVKITWTGDAEGTITLILRSGDASNLAAGTVIASNIPNSGSYTYTASEKITAGSDYALQIVDDSDPSNNNYSGMFVLDSPNTVATSTPIVSVAAPTGSELPNTSTLAPTASPSAFPTGDMSSGSESSSGSSTSSSSDSSTTSDSSSSMSMTTSAGSQSSTAAPTLEQTSTEAGAAARATAAGAMLGAVALAALAL